MEERAPAPDFSEYVEAAIEGLPPDLREAMSNVAIVIEDEPPAGRPLLGLYQGVPLTRRGSRYAAAPPDKISIYRGPLERVTTGTIPWLSASRSGAVVLHEIAHHFGIATSACASSTATEIPGPVCERSRAASRRRGLSQTEIAAQLFITPKTVGGISSESSRRWMSTVARRRCARARAGARRCRGARRAWTRPPRRLAQPASGNDRIAASVARPPGLDESQCD